MYTIRKSIWDTVLTLKETVQEENIYLHLTIDSYKSMNLHIILLGKWHKKTTVTFACFYN